MEEKTLLHISAVMEYLLKNGLKSKLRCSDKFGHTPFTLAIVAGQEKAARLLVNKGKAYGAAKALRLAASRGMEEITQILLLNKVDPNLRFHDLMH